MPHLIVSSLEYGALVPELLSERLKRAGESFTVDGRTVLVGKTQAAAGAISELLVHDLRPLELARLVKLLPVSLREKRSLLPRALRLSEDADHLKRAKQEVLRFMRGGEKLYAEGFLRFRLPFVVEDWALAVDRAGEELAIGREYGLLLGLLEGPEKRKGDELELVLHEDGGFVITGGNGCRIESAETREDPLLMLLVSLRPERLTVYDLTGGGNMALLRTIGSLFGARARFFTPCGSR